MSVVSTVLVICTVFYFTLRDRSIQKAPAAPLATTASEPNIKNASAPLDRPDESPTEDANLRSARPRPERISKTEDESPTELWGRVRKGNQEAEVALAKLYLEGTAVERSCEQAHLLLLAASRKRSTAADSLLAGAYAKQCPWRLARSSAPVFDMHLPFGICYARSTTFPLRRCSQKQTTLCNQHTRKLPEKGRTSIIGMEARFLIAVFLIW